MRQSLRAQAQAIFTAVVATLAFSLSMQAWLYVLALLFAASTRTPFNVALATVTTDGVHLGSASLLAACVTLPGALRLHGLIPPEGAQWRATLQLSWVPYRVVLVSFLTGFALQFPLAEVAVAFESVWPTPLEQRLAFERLLRPTNPVAALGILFAVVIVAPWTEELLFRGAIFRGLERDVGRWAAALVSSVLFGVIHVRPSSVGVATLAGLLLAWLTLRTRSVVPAIALHTGVNAAPLLLREELLRVPGINTSSTELEHVPWPFVCGGALVALGGVAVIRRAFSGEQAEER